MKQQRPNIIIITTDQQRTDTLSCYGATYTDTPNLDRLASEGVRCDRAYTVNPVCTPARFSILTGQYLSRHGAWNVGMTCPEDQPTLSGLLCQAGYRTHLIGKAHFQAYGCPDHESVECCSKWDDDWPANWNGPYYGFETVEMCMGHATYGRHGHYAQWVRSKVSDEAFGTLNRTTCLSDTKFGGEAYDWNLPLALHSSVWVAERTIEFIKNRDGDTPFMLSLGFQDPHHPHCVPTDFDEKVDPDKVPLPKRRENEHDDKPGHFILANQGRLENSVYRGKYPVAGQGHGADFDAVEEKDARLGRAYYYSLVKIIDQQVGRIMDCLEEENVADNTIIIFTTDHGELLGDHGIWMKGPFHYEELVRIPFIVRWPQRIAGGRSSEGLINQVDIVPTVLAAAGVEIPDDIDGVNALPMLQDSSGCTRDYTIVECVDDPDTLRLKTVITPTRKLTYYHGQDFGELYDLENDPDEFINYWDDPGYASDRIKLMSIIIDHMERLERREHRYAYA